MKLFFGCFHCISPFKCNNAFPIQSILQVNRSAGQTLRSDLQVSCLGWSLAPLRGHSHAILDLSAVIFRVYAQPMRMTGKNDHEEVFIVLFLHIEDRAVIGKLFFALFKRGVKTILVLSSKIPLWFETSPLRGKRVVDKTAKPMKSFSVPPPFREGQSARPLSVGRGVSRRIGATVD